MISFEGTSIFRRVIDADRGTMTEDLARFVLDLDFPATDHARFAELSAGAQRGALTEAEARELDGYIEVDGLLAILRAKAERALAR